MKTLISLAIAAMLAGCGQQEAPKQQAEEPAKVIPAKQVRTHNYALRDGYEYGYERIVSEDERSKGQAVNSLMMAKYAGQRDGKYQVYIKDSGQSNLYVVAECTNPCEFMKSMVFFQGRLVSSERMRVQPGIIGWMILEDAINGRLEQFIGEKNGRPVSFWFDEKKGLIVTPLPDKTSDKT